MGFWRSSKVTAVSLRSKNDRGEGAEGAPFYHSGAVLPGAQRQNKENYDGEITPHPGLFVFLCSYAFSSFAYCYFFLVAFIFISPKSGARAVPAF